ncbi:MAG: ribonuclease H-like domain-containing protein [Deltaproteobacteria bacterium]|nr:ribonuclease H-like domain-containing protein [Deltaproteobacteria bacterium]
MLENTFLHIPGIGIKTEKRLWKSGIYSWDLFLNHRKTGISPKKLDTMFQCLKESKTQMASLNPNYFDELIPAGHHWRFFPEFRNTTVYLDIETTGLSPYYETITTISLYDGKSIFYYVKDQNLDDFPEDIKQYKVIVTYNGKSFDIPFIERYFDIQLNQAHMDLRYILASLGYKGGLKSCETRLGFNRGDLTDIDGFFAVLLWHDYLRNRNEKALETLLAYNIQDVLNLEMLMVISYNLKIKDTPFYQNSLPEPVLPKSPFLVDMETVERIRSEQMYFGFA